MTVYFSFFESGSMILETVLGEISHTQAYLRALGSSEELLWQTVDVATLHGRPRLLPTSHHPLPDFVEQTECTISLACTA